MGHRNSFCSCASLTPCAVFHSKNGDLSYFVQFGVLAEHVHRARERGSVLRVCLSPAPFCNLQSQRKRGRTFLLICQSRAARVSNERPRLKAFCRVAFSVRLKLRAMLAARVFLPANRFNVRMSRLVHARLFIDLLHGLKKKLSAVFARLESRHRRRFDLNHIRAFSFVEKEGAVCRTTDTAVNQRDCL
jgi:hypothetical protein